MPIPEKVSSGRKIISRDRSFNFEKDKLFSYTKLTKIGTNLVNSLSLLFPVGEKFFIQAVRDFEFYAEDDKPFMEDIKEFYKQEAKHSREHNKLNLLLKERGLDLDKIEKEISELLKSEVHHAEDALIITICLEKITGALAHIIDVIDPLVFKDNEFCEMLRWHITEEKEHVHVPEKLAEYAGIPKKDIWRQMPRVSWILLNRIVKNYKEVSKLV